jgi:DNA-binding MarR family transcriptional regulator
MKEFEVRTFRKLLRRLERQIGDALKDGVECCGVTLMQCHSLLEIEEKAETNLKDLSASLDLDKSTVSRTIDGLVKSELVERTTDADNRKFVVLKLTGRGKEICKNINRICDDYYQRLLDNIPQGKCGQVVESLNLFLDAMIKAGKIT